MCSLSAISGMHHGVIAASTKTALLKFQLCPIEPYLILSLPFRKGLRCFGIEEEVLCGAGRQPGTALPLHRIGLEATIAAPGSLVAVTEYQDNGRTASGASCPEKQSNSEPETITNSLLEVWGMWV